MIVAAITALAEMTTSIMGKTPDYDEKKRKEWFELLQSYETESKRKINEDPGVDDDLIMTLREKIINFGAAFAKEIK